MPRALCDFETGEDPVLALRFEYMTPVTLTIRRGSINLFSLQIHFPTYSFTKCALHHLRSSYPPFHFPQLIELLIPSQSRNYLTYLMTPDSDPIHPRVVLDCEISDIIIDPTKTALLVIDMQNIALSSAYAPAPAMQAAEQSLLKYAIPTARKLCLQIVWLNWGLTKDDDYSDYGLSEREGDPTEPVNFLRCGEHPRLQSSPGDNLGKVKSEDGTEIEAGRKMMRDTWNASLHEPLLSAYHEGRKTDRPDVWIHKNKNSGLWNPTSACTDYLQTNGIRTLLFSGVNIDQCVVGMLQDAHARGFDTIMLKDACATDSPWYAQMAAEYNLCRNWGFLSSCKALAKAASIQVTNSPSTL
ncbi:Isochorismatase hydrolase [Melanomma pulvis-pyrius CBS 109.77]|uniref:Isochorismatase hydrolase n=1 Tax=Melanomma pulvis-pyrius CBS 109.77 TaxID=1314802 RepID=A0A6A6X0K5_9PLEO|nr:Isochorismatase hydrolase [Melanomma pulvis-pyrius CBS 109.77]